jgi:hypothetical protein
MALYSPKEKAEIRESIDQLDDSMDHARLQSASDPVFALLYFPVWCLAMLVRAIAKLIVRR